MKKKIALVGGSFNANVTHEEIKKCILEKYPSAKVYMFDEVGTGGPFSVGSQSQKTKQFQDKLKDLEIDAVISGNCGCGLCTVKETGSSIAAEYIGIPTVTIGGPTFVDQIHSTGVNRGVLVLRTATYPGAFSSDSKDELVKKTRENLWPEIEKGLLNPITEEEEKIYELAGERPYDEIVYYWANTGSKQDDKRTIEQEYYYLKNNTDEKAALTDTPEWMKGVVSDDKIMTIATMNKGQTPMLITGDASRNKFQVMPGGGYVTFEIELPDNWNELVTPLGYEPIEKFYLLEN